MKEDDSDFAMIVGRPQSPAVEKAMQKRIIQAIALLLQNKSLYQSVRIDAEFLADYSDHNSQYKTSHTTLDMLQSEFNKRPWKPFSHGHGDEPQFRSIYKAAAAGAQPLGTPVDEINIPIPLPDLETWCVQCNKTTTFSSLLLSGNAFGSPYPVYRQDIEEVFIFYYKCNLCRSQLLTYMVKRVGLVIQLCGRSERVHFQTPPVIAKRYRDIVNDALSAAAENDALGACYHLRTFIEHYIKSQLSLGIGDQIRGDDLCARYSQSLDSRMNSGLPSLAVIWQELSKIMHTRTGSHEDFTRLLQDTYAHLEAKQLFEKYSR